MKIRIIELMEVRKGRKEYTYFIDINNIDFRTFGLNFCKFARSLIN